MCIKFSNLSNIFIWIMRFLWTSAHFLEKLNINSPASVYLFEVNNGTVRVICEIWWKLTIKKPEQHSEVFIGKFSQKSHIVLVLPLLTLNMFITAWSKPTEIYGDHKNKNSTFLDKEWTNTYAIRNTSGYLSFENVFTNVLTYFSTQLHFIKKPVIAFAVQMKWLIFIWFATLDWKGSNKHKRLVKKVGKVSSDIYVGKLTINNLI